MAIVDSHAHPVCSASSENRRIGPESNRVLPTGVEARPGPCGGPLRATIPEGECIRRIVLKSPVLEYCPPGSVRGARGNPRPYLDNEAQRPKAANQGVRLEGDSHVFQFAEDG